MKGTYRENTDYPMDDNPSWKLLEDNYNKYYLNYDGNKTPDIPQNIHFIWLGGQFPQKYKRMQETWSVLHPTWQIKVWDDNDAENFGMINKKTYDAIQNPGAKSDIFRYEILHRHGGLYIDTDFMCLKPFDLLLYLDFFAGGGWNAFPVLFNGLMACKPNDGFIKTVIDEITRKQIKPHYGLDQILDLVGPLFITDIYLKYIKTTTDKTVLFPNRFFYPMPATIRTEVREDNRKNRERIYSYAKHNSYCIHLWHTSWQN
jgi:mannosyltransferase OCH1-like enzyme